LFAEVLGILGQDSLNGDGSLTQGKETQFTSRVGFVNSAADQDSLINFVQSQIGELGSGTTC
jgi:hypothetical protein